jgi:hypothetical protein
MDRSAGVSFEAYQGTPDRSQNFAKTPPDRAKVGRNLLIIIK